MVAVEDYDLTLDCWRSGQVSDAAFVETMADDPLFSAWVLEHLRERAE